MPRCAVGCVLVSWLAGCATSPAMPAVAAPASTQAWLAPFAEALQFVPPGMQSHWLRIGSNPAEGGEPARHWLEVRAGRDFAPIPAQLAPYVGVHVIDAGPGGITLAEMQIAEAEKRAPFGATPVWCTRETQHGRDGVAVEVETWGALVDERFLVDASSEALLHAALARNHVVRFGSLEPLPALPPDTVALVLRDLPAATSATANPTAVEPSASSTSSLRDSRSAILACASAPARLMAWAGNERDLRALLPTYCATAVSGPQDRPSVQCELAPEHASPESEFVLIGWVFFGAMALR